MRPSSLVLKKDVITFGGRAGRGQHAAFAFYKPWFEPHQTQNMHIYTHHLHRSSNKMTEHYSEERVVNWVDKDLVENDHTDIPLHQPGYDENVLYPKWMEMGDDELQQVEIPETPPRPSFPLIYTKMGVVRLPDGERVETTATIERVIHLREPALQEDDRDTILTKTQSGPSSSSTEDIQELTVPQKKLVMDKSTRKFVQAVRDLQAQEKAWRQRWQWDEQDDRLKVRRNKRDREEFLALDRKQADRRVAELTSDVVRVNKRRFLKLGNHPEQPILIH